MDNKEKWWVGIITGLVIAIGSLLIEYKTGWFIGKVCKEPTDTTVVNNPPPVQATIVGGNNGQNEPPIPTVEGEVIIEEKPNETEKAPTHISGDIKDASGNSIADVQIRGQNQTVFSRENGKFEILLFFKSQMDEVALTFEKTGYETEKHHINRSMNEISIILNKIQ